MSKRRHKEVESSVHHSEHQAHHAESSSVEHTKKEKKGYPKTMFAGIAVLAVVFFAAGYLASMAGGVSTAKSGDQLTFISPPGCLNCVQLEANAKAVAATLKVPYAKTGIEQNMTAPGLVLVYNGTFLGAMGFDSEYSLKNDVCLLTKNPDVCNQAKQLTAPAASGNTQPQPTGNIPKADKANVKFFTMSYCPYGNQAETGLIPVYNLLKDKVAWEPHFIIYANYQGGGPTYCIENGSYCSMHGVQELHEDIRELCIWKYETHDKFFSYLGDVNTACTSQNVDTCWEAVAAKHSIDTTKVKTCQADEGVALVKAEFEADAKYGAQGSPYVLVNDAEYQGGRAPEDYKNAICAAFNSPPAECSQSLGSGSAAATGGCG